MKLEQVVKELKSRAHPENIEGMARFGINPNGTLGVCLPDLRDIASRIGKDQDLALKLWRTGIHDARILAALVGDPKETTEEQMEAWASDFDSWDVVDGVCSNLFDKTQFAYSKAVEWSGRDEEFVKRAGFVLMAVLSVHDKRASDSKFKEFFTLIKRESTDERNFVKKAVNWALRQIGKRNLHLNGEAIRLAQEIGRIDSRSAKWIATDALRDLENNKLQERLSARARKPRR